ncbi:Uncharacterised protein [Citrobacter koseri]|nr:Uncharacterised protein [Citrobacter koseri]STT23490.1 Uncharacterised protein [Citrobacter koseri]
MAHWLLDPSVFSNGRDACAHLILHDHTINKPFPDKGNDVIQCNKIIYLIKFKTLTFIAEFNFTQLFVSKPGLFSLWCSYSLHQIMAPFSLCCTVTQHACETVHMNDSDELIRSQ